MTRLTGWTLWAFGTLLLNAAAAHAQTIAGVVKDDTGAVMPGVTVEAKSPALIEKVRSAVSDGAGQYKITNLSPGLYTVTFTLPGFSTVLRDGIELSTDFTASVNVELKVGAIEETITVSGASPLVDMQAVTKQTVLTRDVLDALPTSRSIAAAGVLIPGVTMSGSSGGGRDVGGTTKLQQPGLTFRGVGGAVQRWDGFWLNNMQGGGTATSYYVNDSGAQELVYTTGADSLDIATPNIYINMVPKDGGNRFSGTLFADFTHKPWSWTNLSDGLKKRFINDVSKVYKIYDFNPGIGGPIKRDKLWFFYAYRYEEVSQTVVDNYYDKNPNPYLYEPDFSRPGTDDGNVPNQSARLTWQASSKDKVQWWVTDQHKERLHYMISASRTPDAASHQETPHANAQTLKWTRTQTNRLLFEGGVARGHVLYEELYQPGVCPDDKDREKIQACTVYSITDSANGKSFGSNDTGYSGHGGWMQNARFSATYVTGSHEFKVGTTVGHTVSPSPTWWAGDITMTFNNGVPQSITKRIPSDLRNGNFPDLGIYAQDRWAFKRATVTGGLRYDYFVGKVLDGTLPPSRWNSAQFFPGFEVQHWKDLSPRVGVAFDLFGDGRTAVKSSLARYVAVDSVTTAGRSNPQDSIGRTDTVNWDDKNKDYTIYNPDGSLQADELGPTTNANFGKVIPSTTTTDPATLNGFGVRGSTWEWQAVVQRELTPRVAVNGGYYFRWLGNQTATQNTLRDTNHYDGPFCIKAPLSPDLPNGGGYDVCGLYDVKVASRSLVQNNITFAKKFGGITDHFMGYDVGLTARLSPGTTITGGLNAQRRVWNTCNAPIPSGGAATAYTVDNPEARFCDVVTPFRPDFKLLATYALPWSMVVSGTYQVSSGPQVTATWVAPNSIISAPGALGRNLATGANGTKSIQLIQPGTVYAEYQNQLDMRVSRRFTFGRVRVRADANLYNVFNSDFANSINTNFSTTASNRFMTPTAVLQGRLFKIGGQLDF